MPSDFNVSRIVPIPKDDKGNLSDMSNIRPLSISDVYANIFERLVMLNIKKHHTLPDLQFGFKEKSSCSHAVMTLLELAKMNVSRHKNTFACAIDASKAFDKVDRDSLLVKLMDKMSLRYWLALRNYYGASCGYVVNNGQCSDIFKTTVGVKQGGPVSPLLFAIYAEDLIAEVQELENGVQVSESLRIGILMYADDVVLVSSTEEDLNTSLQVCEQFGMRW